MDYGRGATVATRKRDRIVRVVGVIVAALIALIGGASRDAHSQVTGPSVTSISPNSGPTAGGTLVTITGDNLARVTAVQFGSTAVTSFTVRGATSITAISPG